MKKFTFINILAGFLILIITVPTSGKTNPGTIKMTEAVNPENNKEVFVIIESTDSLLQKKLVDELVEQESLLTLVQQKNGKTINNAPLIVKQNKKGFSRSNATRDCLLGTGSCLLGILIVQAVGEETATTTADGFYATAGDKRVEGGGACVVATFWAVGLILGVKGLVELFLPKEELPDNDTSELTTQQIIDSASLVKVSEKTVVINDNSAIQKKVIPYLLTKTWL